MNHDFHWLVRAEVHELEVVYTYPNGKHSFRPIRRVLVQGTDPMTPREFQRTYGDLRFTSEGQGILVARHVYHGSGGWYSVTVVAERVEGALPTAGDMMEKLLNSR